MPREKRRLETTDFTIAIDTREQRPFTFAKIRGRSGRLIIPKLAKSTLSTGDYSIIGMEGRIAIERKSPSDLFGVVGKDRERFVRELERLSSYEFAAIVIESSIEMMSLSPPEFSRVTPSSVVNSLLSWSVRFGVHVFDMPGRSDAENATFFLLSTFYKNAHGCSTAPIETSSTIHR